MNKFLLSLFTLLFSLNCFAANLDFYLAGGFNGWQPNLPQHKFTQVEDGIYSIYMVSLSGDFKITTSGWEQQFGCDYKIEYGKTYKCVQTGNGSNIVLPEDPAKNITITFNYNDKTIRVDKPVRLFLTGDFNDWLLMSSFEFEFLNGVYTLSTNSFSGRFKIAAEDWAFNFGRSGEISLGNDHSVESNGDDMYFAGSESNNGRILITLTPDSRTVTHIFPDIELEDAPVEYFNLHGVKIDNPSKGVYIMRQGLSVKKIILH